MAGPTAQTVEVDGRRLRVSNLGKILYPETGTTKADVIRYYQLVAEPLIRHARHRPLTRKRWPNGVGTADHPIDAFFEKDLGMGVPDWVRRTAIPHSSGAKQYPLVDDRATLAWLAQSAALELHVPQWQLGPDGEPQNPDRIVFDFDPGPGVDLPATAAVAFIAKDILDGMGLASYPVTSGSKGIHVYAPLDGSLTSDQASQLAKQLARALETDHPDLVVSDMKKTLRVGKVLIDWSQNNARKTTIAPYSLRGLTRPTAAAPRTWDELEDPDLRHLTFEEVIDRYERDGDLLAPLARERPGDEMPAYRPRDQVTAAPARDTGTDVPYTLFGPVEVMLAKAAERVPTQTALPGGTTYEPKWDGFRALAIVRPTEVRIFSRQRKELTGAFPEVVDAVRAQVPAGTVLDGELIRWVDGHLDFDALQRRNSTSKRTVGRLVDAEPISFVAFDVLAAGGRDLRRSPQRERRATLEGLAASWHPPLTLTPSTGDHGTAVAWMEELAPTGIEGVVAKGAGEPYSGGKRGWVKVRHRDTIDVIAGAVTGTLTQPGELILGRYVDGELRIVGRSAPIGRGQVVSLIQYLRPAADDHPWPEKIRSTAYDRFNTKREIPLTRIEPIVVEVTVDTSVVGGSIRHPARFVRVRTDVDPESVTG